MSKVVGIPDDFETYSDEGQTLNGSNYHVYANIVIKDGVLKECHLIPNKDHPHLNAMYKPNVELHQTQCDPVFIGDMYEWVKNVRICNENILFFKIDGGYKISSHQEYCCWHLLFDENGLLHSDTNPAFSDHSVDSFTEIFATHGEYTPGKINEFNGKAAYISSGKITPNLKISKSGIKINDTDIEILPDYSGPAYVLTEGIDYGVFVFTFDEIVYSAYPV